MLDWDWELPAVTLCTIVLGVGLIRLAGPVSWGRQGGRWMAVLATARMSIISVVVAVTAHVGNGAAAEAQDAL